MGVLYAAAAQCVETAGALGETQPMLYCEQCHSSATGWYIPNYERNGVDSAGMCPVSLSLTRLAAHL